MASGPYIGQPPQPPTTTIPDNMRTDISAPLPMQQEWNTNLTGVHADSQYDQTYDLHNIVLLFQGPLCRLWQVIHECRLSSNQRVILYIDNSHSASNLMPLFTAPNHIPDIATNVGHLAREFVDDQQNVLQMPPELQSPSTQNMQEISQSQTSQIISQMNPAGLDSGLSYFSHDYTHSYEQTNASVHSPLTSTLPPTTPLPTTPSTLPMSPLTDVETQFLDVPESSLAASRRPSMRNRSFHSDNTLKPPRWSPSNIRPRPGGILPTSPGSKSTQDRQPRIDQTEWDKIWSRVEQLYPRREEGGEGRTLTDVRDTIREEYGFEASEAQFKKQLKKREMAKNRAREG